jgi:hypothetical protein
MPRPAPLVLSCYVRTDRDALKSEQPASRPLSCASRRVIGVGRSKDANDMVNNLCLEANLEQ